MSLGKYVWSASENTLYSHLYVGGSVEWEKATVEVESVFPWKGKVSYTVHPCQRGERFGLAVRIPSYVKERTVRINGAETESAIPGQADCLEEGDGHLYIVRKWQEGDRLDITFPMPVRKVYCNPAVRENENGVAIMRGSIVYCFEGVDNGDRIQEIRISGHTDLKGYEESEGILKGMVLLEGEAQRRPA